MITVAELEESRAVAACSHASSFRVVKSVIATKLKHSCSFRNDKALQLPTITQCQNESVSFFVFFFFLHRHIEMVNVTI